MVGTPLYDVSHGGGRPRGTTQEAGYNVGDSGGRQVLAKMAFHDLIMNTELVLLYTHMSSTRYLWTCQ